MVQSPPETDSLRYLADFFSHCVNLRRASGEDLPWRDVANGVLQAAHGLLDAEQVVLLHVDPQHFEWRVAGARGLAPEAADALRVRLGIGILGKALQGTKTVVAKVGTPPPQASASTDKFLQAPYILVPCTSRHQVVGLLICSRPASGDFAPSAVRLAELIAAEASLLLENLETHQRSISNEAWVVRGFERALAARDPYSHGHSKRMSLLSKHVAEAMKLPQQLIAWVETGAILHDLGKIGIEDLILRKAGPLTPDEYRRVQEHPAIGRTMLADMDFLNAIWPIVYYHHEWFNGQGYPEKLAREEIPLGARIVSVVDAWDAMTSDRTYRKAMPKSAAVAELRRQAGTQFDPVIVDIFLKVLEHLESKNLPTTEKEFLAVTHA